MKPILRNATMMVGTVVSYLFFIFELFLLRKYFWIFYLIFLCFADNGIEWIISESGEGWLDQNGEISTLIQIVDQNNMDDCKTACLATPDCVGFTFVGVISRCDLKNNLQAMTLNGGYHSSVVSGKWFTVLGKLLRD